MAVIGIWRDDMKVDQEEVKAFVEAKGREYVIDNVTDRCPTNAIKLNDDNTVTVNNKECVRCMHCINVMTKALAPGDDTGVTVLIGGKRTLKIGDMMGTVIVPFKKVDTIEQIEELVELTGEMIDFFAENALEHERTGEMIERIGLVNYLEGIGLDLDPNMVSEPRQCSYVRMDGWDEEVKQWYDKKAEAASA
jgi:sulfite reductase alpha subunit